MLVVDAVTMLEPMIEPKVYFLEDRNKEIHMFGNYVGIVWNVEGITETITSEGGHRQKTVTYKRTGNFYIGFPFIRGDSDEEYYLDDDQTIDGGLTVEAARQVAKELMFAAKYLERMIDKVQP